MGTYRRDRSFLLPMSNHQPVPEPILDPVIAVGFLTERDLTVLGQGFRRAYRLHDDHQFHELLVAIDQADRARR